jgi:hypothetical protein
MTTFNGLRATGTGRIAKIGTTMPIARMAAPRRGRTSMVVEAKKVAVLGAAGGIGQPLSMLLKMNPLVTDLALYDIANVLGVAADLSHCNTPVKVGSAAPLTIFGVDMAAHRIS